MRPASFDDYDAIAQVESAAGLSPRPREVWMNLWKDNPAYDAVADWPIGWVLVDGDGRVVGSIGNIPSLYEMQGRTYLAATFVGWAVHQHYRRFSLNLVAHSRQHPQVDLHLVNTASPATEAVFTRLGWSRVPVGRWNRSALWVTSYSGAIRAYLKTKLPDPLASMATPLCAPFQLIDAFFRRGARYNADCEFQWITEIDESFDGFWKDLAGIHSEMFLAHRTRATLRWHFQNSLKRNECWILTARQESKLTGYAILQRKDSPSMGLTRAILVDFQTLRKNRALSSAMISRALDRCRQEKIHVLENPGCWVEDLQPNDASPSTHRDLGCWCYLYKARDRSLAEVLETKAAWYPTQFDGDASL